MPTKAERRRQKKRKNRERRIHRMANIRRNLPNAVFRLDVLIDEVWRSGVKSFSNMGAVLAHKDDTEKRRLAGEFIVPGKVIDIRNGNVVLQIEGSVTKSEESLVNPKELPEKTEESSAKIRELPVKIEEPSVKAEELPVKPEEPSMKGVLPDKLADNAKAEKKGFWGFWKKK